MNTVRTSWENELAKEIASYQNIEKDSYQPKPFSGEQLRKAAMEFYRRWKEGEDGFKQEELPESDHGSPFVLATI